MNQGISLGDQSVELIATRLKFRGRNPDSRSHKIVDCALKLLFDVTRRHGFAATVSMHKAGLQKVNDVDDDPFVIRKNVYRFSYESRVCVVNRNPGRGVKCHSDTQCLS